MLTSVGAIISANVMVSCFSSQELTEYEKAAQKMKLTLKGAVCQHTCAALPLTCLYPKSQLSNFHADLEQDGFCKNPFFNGIIAEVPEHLKTKDGERKPPC